MKIQTATEMAADRPWLKVALYGETGTGKTRWAATAPMPLVLLKEPQGLITIQDVCPDALVAPIKNWKGFCRDWNLIKSASHVTTEDGQPASMIKLSGVEYVYQTLVIDSFTDVQRMMLAGFDKGAKNMNLDVTRISTEQWGRITTLTQRILDDQRALHCNVIMTLLAHDEFDAKKRRRVLPTISGKFRGSAGQFFNAFGHATLSGEALSHVIKWKANRTYVTKPAPGWPDVTPASITLGDLAMFTLGDSAPHCVGDSADKVQAIVDLYAAQKIAVATAAKADAAVVDKKPTTSADGGNNLEF